MTLPAKTSSQWRTIVMFSFSGLWPPSHGIARYLYLCYSLLFFGAQIFLSVGLVGAIYVKWGNMEKVIESTGSLFGGVSGLFKMFLILPRTDKVQNIADTLDEMIRKQAKLNNDVFSKMLHVASFKSKLMFYAFMVPCFFVYTTWTFFPFIHKWLDETATSRYPTGSYYFYDDVSSPNYEITYVLQAVGLWCAGLVVPTVDLLFFSLMIHTSTHLRILNLRLSALGGNMNKISREVANIPEKENGKNSPIPSNRNASNPVSGSDHESLAYCELRTCVQYHQTIIRFVEEIENVMNVIVLPQFLACILIMCMTLFQSLEKTKDTVMKIKSILYLLIIFGEVFIYCWFAHGVLEESSLLSEASYNSDWIGGSTRLKSSLRIIMTRSQKPLKLTTGKFYSISRGTFVSLMNISYSYYAVLSQLYSRED